MDPETLRLAGVYALSVMGAPALSETSGEEEASAAGEESRRRQLAARELVRRLLVLDEQRPGLGLRAQLQDITAEARRNPDGFDFAKKLAPIVVSATPYLQAA